jgi:fatty acid desaturase
MPKEYEPLDQVRKNLRIPWYRCPIEPAKLKELTRRSDLRGAFQAGGHLAMVAVTAAATYYFFNQKIWIGFALALFVHGTIYSFIGGNATHELAHGTVFRTKWLNSLFLRFLSLISWFNFHNYKMSHTYHHLYTLHPRGDREVVLPTTPYLHVLHLLQMFTFNLFGGRREPYSYPIVANIGGTAKLAFTGKFNKEWLEAVYADQEEARKKAITWARVILLFHLTLIAASIVFKLWLLPVLITLAPFIANWLRYFVGTPMHTGLRDNVPDFRLCVFAAVPCYNLRKLYRAVASDMPKPRTLFGAWREMRQTWKKQQKDPGYQYDTPLPKPKDEQTKKQDSIEASLGDLAPKTLE